MPYHLGAVPYLDSGALVRVLPDWYVDGGMLALYFPARNLLQGGFAHFRHATETPLT